MAENKDKYYEIEQLDEEQLNGVQEETSMNFVWTAKNSARWDFAMLMTLAVLRII